MRKSLVLAALAGIGLAAGAADAGNRKPEGVSNQDTGAGTVFVPAADPAKGKGKGKG
ncbi:hypothetical protein KXS07_22795 [Inquilinus limosus]|uniref:hypothetical protein n=1 Tax=Inquilinus limosus TaxID=171674 RepID=UPI003F18C0ED